MNEATWLIIITAVSVLALGIYAIHEERIIRIHRSLTESRQEFESWRSNNPGLDPAKDRRGAKLKQACDYWQAVYDKRLRAKRKQSKIHAT